MSSPVELLQKIQRLKKIYQKYQPEAYSFVLEALDFTMKKLPKSRHLTGRELLDGIRQYGLNQFGAMARSVFEYWGVRKTVDFGHIVFDLVEAELLRKTEEDSINDFKRGFDFKKAFDGNYQFQD